MVGGLYALLDVETVQRRGIDPAAAAEAVLEGGARVLQLRWKQAPAGPLLALARRLRALTQACRACFIVNDRVDVAALSEADGVHLGQEDLPIHEARAMLPPGAVVGLSTHSAAELAEALAAGADYVGYGPIYPTATKAAADPPVGLEGLREAVTQAGPTPVVAIGGLTEESLEGVARTGASAAAVVGDLFGRGDPGARARALRAAFERGRP